MPSYASAIDDIRHTNPTHDAMTQQPETEDTAIMKLIINDYNPFKWVLTTNKDTMLQAFQTKLILKMLPTQVHEFFFGGPTSLPYCKCCLTSSSQQYETMEHLFTCPAISQETKMKLHKIWEHLLKPLKRHIRQNWQHFIADTLTDNDVLGTKYILYGVMPSHIIHNILEYHPIQHSSDKFAHILQSAFYNAHYHMQTALYTLIWKPRCKQTTKWEKDNNITKDTKETYDRTRRQQRKLDPVHYDQAKLFIRSIQHTTDSAVETDLRIRAWTNEHNLGTWVPTVISVVDSPLTATLDH